MVGQVGALHNTDPAPRVQMEAVNYAFKLVNDDKAQKKALQEIRDAAENNQAVYDKAADLLRELSTKERALRDLEADADRRVFEAQEAERRVKEASDAQNSELALRRGALERDEAAHQSRVKDADKALSEREKTVKARETAVTAKEKEVAHRSSVLDIEAASLAQERDRLGKARAAFLAAAELLR